MRILFISFYYEPDLCAGSFRATTLANELSEKLDMHSSIDILTTEPNRYDSFKVTAKTFQTYKKLKINRIKVPSHKSGFFDQSISFIYFAIGVYKKTKNKEYDLVFATSSRLMTAFLASLISRKIKTPLYLDIRDIFLDIFSELIPRSIFYLFFPFFNFLEKYTMSRASKINLVSEGFKDYFDLKYPNKEYSYIPNGIDDIFLQKDFSKNLENSTIEILYAGNIGKGQALEKIIPALVTALPDKYKFTIIGDGGGLKKLKNETKLHCDGEIQFIEPLPREELINYYKKADILFLHLNDLKSLDRVLPSKIFEYGATGKPILAGLKGQSKIFLKKFVENSYVFDPCSVESAIKQIQKINLMHSNRSEFKKKFSREFLTSKLSEDIFMTASENER
ncbi:glycosyltransferase family 4 protein [SAR86 cluster bacterium]|nr:glycosyltransferase family 4 protein [SAR86 cluster bacterium]